ncbi:MAG TPA: CDGSH iron-sulfur domain-containing protein [Solirubrobacteraceae bacterium]|jgi:CDGSH-type Zn-finger protein
MEQRPQVPPDVKLVVNGADVEVADRHAKTPLLLITPTESGPDLVSGPVTVTAPDARVIDHTNSMTICRCGHSSNKPFCDGTHATIDFDGTLAN